MGRLFGTDGARGVANTELTCTLAMKIGSAAAMVLTDDTHRRPKVLIGKDTRQSSDMLENALAAGLCSVGADVLTVGVVPTPAVAYLVTAYQCDAGIMISASHNPCEYNGIKIFKGTGYKLDDRIEEEIEAIVLDDARPLPEKIGGDVGTVTRSKTAAEDYIQHILSTVDVDFQGMKIALDCANGSASATAEQLFTRLGAQVSVLHAQPDGVNINDQCGSTHIGSLQAYVKAHGCDLGLAFDGDADRLLAVDHQGSVVDGDQIITICAQQLQRDGALHDNTAVVTVMSNMGFFKFCESHNIHCEITKVGDRYVLENMLANGYSIGGEQSGHIIFLDLATTGDGQLSAVQLLRAVRKSGKTLEELAAQMNVYPQVLINVTVGAEGKARYEGDEVIQSAIQKAERELDGSGRVLVRISGTEPLIRVMLEGSDPEQIQRLGEQIAAAVKERLC